MQRQGGQINKKISQKIKDASLNIKVLLPVSSFTIFWYLFVTSIMILDFFITIFTLCFDSQSKSRVYRPIVQWVLIIVFFADILVSLNTSFIQSGTIIDDPRTTRLKYIKSMVFFMDIIALAGVICQLTLSEKLVYFDFISLVKIRKIFSFNELLTKYAIKSSKAKFAFEITKNFILIFLICHVIGSLFFYLDVILLDLGWYPNDMLWVYNSYAHINIIELSMTEQYIYSFYYAIVTLSGVAYGDLTPLNPTQTLFTMFSLLIPLTIYAFLFTAVLNMITQQREKRIQAKKYKKIIINYLNDSGIDQSEYAKYVNYLIYKYKESKMSNISYMSQISPSVNEAFIRNIFINSFNFKLFQSIAKSKVQLQQITELICSIGQQQSYPAKQVLGSSKSNPIKLFFLLSGQVVQYVEIKKQKCYKLIKAGQFINKYAFFTGVSFSPLNHVLQLKQQSIFLSLSLDKFNAKMRNQLLFQQYHNLRNDIIFSGNFRNLIQQCFFCQQKNHVLYNCPRLRLNIKVDSFIAIHNQRNPNYRRSRNKNNKLNNNIVKFVTLFSLQLVEVQKNSYQEKQTQLSENQVIKSNWNISLYHIDRVQNWKVFSPRFSLR